MKYSTDIQMFDFHNHEVRVLTDDNGEPWFVGKDVTTILGYSDTYGALKKHVEDVDKQNCQNDSFESPRGMTIINESGLYSLIQSNLRFEARLREGVQAVGDRRGAPEHSQARRLSRWSGADDAGRDGCRVHALPRIEDR